MPEGVEVLLIAESLKEFFHSKDSEGRGYVDISVEEVYAESMVAKAVIPFSEFNTRFNRVLYEGVETFGKNIFVPLSEVAYLIVQLGMTGTFSTSYSSHSRVKFTVNKNHELYYDDIRKFGCLSLQEKGHFKDRIQLLLTNSIEWRDEKLPKKLYPKIQKRKSWKDDEIKILLMNQFVVAGVGNIYASECLFQAGVHPRRKAGSLSSDECFLLGTKIQEVMWASYAEGGMTVKTYSNFGKKGFGKKLLSVYSRSGSICQACEKAVIQKIVQDNRSTFYCPNCQKME